MITEEKLREQKRVQRRDRKYIYNRYFPVRLTLLGTCYSTTILSIIQWEVSYLTLSLRLHIHVL